MPVIAIREITRIYRVGDQEIQALRGVSFTIERGEFVAIMGASGSGKSTLLNVIGCLDQPSTGEYLLDGIDISHLDEPALAAIRSRRIGFVFQSFNLLARTSAAENVALPLFYSGQGKDSSKKAQEMLALLGLADRERNHPNQLSGGQQQRVAIARALVNDPTILLADEPTGNLDSKTAKEILAAIRALNRERGLTVVLVTHESTLGATADRLITMSDGVIVSDERKAQHLAATAMHSADRKKPDSLLSDVWSFAAMALLAAGAASAATSCGPR